MSIILLFTSCAANFGDIISTDMNADTIADENIEKVVSYIVNKDKDKLKELFSEKSLSNVENFDSQYDTLLNFIEGEFVSWEVNPNRYTSETVDYGKKEVKMCTYGKFVTTSNEYRISVIDFSFNTMDSKNQGIYMIYVSSWDYNGIVRWKLVMKPGIFIPEVDGIDDIDPELVYGKVEGVEEQVD